MSAVTGTDRFECDRCGSDVGGGGVIDCLVVSDLDPDRPGLIRNLHFCRDRTVDGKKVKGCANKITSAANLNHYNSQRPTSDD